MIDEKRGTMAYNDKERRNPNKSFTLQSGILFHTGTRKRIKIIVNAIPVKNVSVTDNRVIGNRSTINNP